MKTLYIIFLTAIGLTSCTSYRMLTNGHPQIGDQFIFPQHIFPASETPYKLPAATKVSDNKTDSRHFLRKHKSLAFLVIRNDSIIREYYLVPELKENATDIFSLSKSFVASTLAIAMQEGYITDLTDTIGEYSPDLPDSYKDIRIIDLLNMRSGIETTFLNTLQLYYSADVFKTSKEMPVIHPSGTTYTYSNQATQLLIALIESATQQKFTDYFFQKVWLPMNMENAGNWSFDSQKNKTPRGFSGLSLTARDVARLGLLYLHSGKLNNQQIIPEQWIKNTITPAEEFQITPGLYYHMHWKILVPGEEFYAKGLLGQYLYINKRTNTVIVRLGLQEASTDWIKLFRSLQD